MNKLCSALLGVVISMTYASAWSQNTVPVRGTITGLSGDVLAVKTREGRDIKIGLTKDTTVAWMKAVKLSDIKAGTALGTAAVENAEGVLVAKEVHVFPPERGVPNEGHRPMAEAKTTMTNALVGATMQSASGRELTLNYKGGTTKVLVPDNTPVVMAMDGDRSYLKTGEYVYLTASVDGDGKYMSSRVQVSKDGVKPPQ